VGKVTASFQGTHAQWACLHTELQSKGFCFGVSLYERNNNSEIINSVTSASFQLPHYVNRAGLTRTIYLQLINLLEIITIPT
jgi:hypothetical protein